MKRIILSLIMTSTGLLFAQSNDQIQNKKGIDILPVKGEFAIGIDASPFLNYIGDLFGSNNKNTALNDNKFLSDYFGSNTIYGKYMVSDKNAIRANMRITTINRTENFKVLDNSALTAGIDSLVNDKRVTTVDGFSIGLGYEFRRGKSRLRGIYGGDVFFQTGKQQTEYVYGNGYGEHNIAPTSMFDSGGNQMTGFGAPTLMRRKYDIGGRTNAIGLRAFAGLEYFIAPKVCFGTEFGYGFSYSTTSEGSRSVELYNSVLANEDGTIGGIDEQKVIFGESSEFNISTDNFNGALYLMFYF